MTDKIPTKEDLTKELNEILTGGSMVVAFMGPKQSGKTTACDVLAEDFGGIKLSFVTELKSIVKSAFGFTDDQMGKDKDQPVATGVIRFREREMASVLRSMSDMLDSVNPNNTFRWASVAANQWVPKEFKTPREVLQWVGTEFIHAVYPDFHCEMLASKIKPNNLYFVDDLRFVSEHDYVNKIVPMFKVVRITGRNEVKSGKEEHASESNWKKINAEYKIDNSDTLTKYKNNVKFLFKKIINNTHKDIKEGNVDLSKTVEKILGDTNESTDSNTVKVGKFVFEKIKQ